MALLAWIILAAVAVLVLIALVQRFYRKTTRDTALLRTGAGGQKVTLTGGLFAVPIFHRVDEVNMRVQRIVVERRSGKALLTEDRLRVDATAEFRVRVAPDAESVAAAVQAFGARVLRTDELAPMLEGRFADAVQAQVATLSLDDLHRRRPEFSTAVRDTLVPELAEVGLKLEAVSLLHFDQTPFSELNENNVFDAVGMRRLAEIVAENKKGRASTEAEAQVAVAKAQLTAAKNRIELDREEREAQIQQDWALGECRSRADASLARAREETQQVAAQARLARERATAAAEIERDQSLKSARMQAQLAEEMERVSHAIALAQRQIDEAAVAISSEQAQTRLALAQESTQAERELASQRRSRELAVARAAQDAEVDAMKVKAESSRAIESAVARGQAERVHAETVALQAEAEARGLRARIGAENSYTSEIVRMRLELARLEALPLLAEKMAKPLEKIDSIRVNHLSGFGGEPSSASATGSGPIDAIYDMALRLPALKRLGEILGTDLDLDVPRFARAESDHARAAIEHARARPSAEPASPSKSS